MPARRLLTAVVALSLIAGGWIAAPYLSAAAVVLDLSGSPGGVRRLLPVIVQEVAARDLQVPTRYGSIPARLYRPVRPGRRSVIVFPGVHAGGVDEPRLAAFSRRLAAAGIITLSVPLPELRRYRITPVSTDMIEDAAAWMADDPTLTPGRQVDMAGVSFAGGLSVVAAGRPRLAGKVHSVIALGGHADLPRVMTYLCTGILPDGTRRPPHDYGVAVIALAAIPKLVPAGQVVEAQQVVTTFLDASSFDSIDKVKAAALFNEARRLANRAPEPSRTLLRQVVDRQVGALGARLVPFIEELGGAAALSAARSPATVATTYLIHGESDNVIPSSETPLLAEYLKNHGNQRVHWLLTPLLSHADVQAPTAGDAWKLIRLWKEMLG